ncbi:UDP-2,3-diacylglucosamine diphosphatase [Saprospira sp. CCB-QB6]|uniref:UDP-2,3-diacylglucosamine diphosphatase n=1 Tax=Saprospira sp. CCB-QB6 TaxID=3023936 RepID=UPI002348F85A|nr:UDP-2,3-diacylglucosamine diphosphatase [Saprospira sp. CCB-QB6]WCL82575.1 UDP-2,3-diacylglucosamine diphosphatase [Saprospira sp. CCB-QB6]
MAEKREIDILVLSDVHLGTQGSEAKALLQYLQSLVPKMLILNGDIIDIWQFRKGFFPQAHWAVLRHFMNLAEAGVPVYYLTGNHDDSLRRLTPFRLGNIYLQDKLLLELDGKRAWFFHGDAYDPSVHKGRFWAKIGGQFYDWSIMLNRGLNRLLKPFGIPPSQFSKRLKASVKAAVQKMNDFEQKAIELGIEKGYDYVVCGHVHRPQHREIVTAAGQITYLNSGDWMEHRSALEYVDKAWQLYHYNAEEYEEPACLEGVENRLEDLLRNIQDGTSDSFYRL